MKAMAIEPEETLIVGAWIMRDGQLTEDTEERRINALIQSELKRLASAAGGWEVLFRDPNDGRYWELSFPRSEMHGGGPKMLRLVGVTEAAQKYDIAAMSTK
jgi:hypothetical protein